MAIRASTYVHVARTGCQLLARRVVPSLCLLRTLLQSASELYRVVQSPTQPPIITRFWASEARPPKGMRHGAAHQARHHTYNTCVITGQTICFLELLRDAARARKALYLLETSCLSICLGFLLHLGDAQNTPPVLTPQPTLSHSQPHGSYVKWQKNL